VYCCIVMFLIDHPQIHKSSVKSLRPEVPYEIVVSYRNQRPEVPYKIVVSYRSLGPEVHYEIVFSYRSLGPEVPYDIVVSYTNLMYYLLQELPLNCLESTSLELLTERQVMDEVRGLEQRNKSRDNDSQVCDIAPK